MGQTITRRQALNGPPGLIGPQYLIWLSGGEAQFLLGRAQYLLGEARYQPSTGTRCLLRSRQSVKMSV